MRTAYRILSWLTTGRAAARGPVPLGRNLVRRESHKLLARGLRKWGL